MKFLNEYLEKSVDYKTLGFAPDPKKRSALIKVPNSIKSWFVAQSFLNQNENIVWVLPDNRYVDSIAQDLMACVGEDNLLVFPDHELDPYEYRVASLSWEEDFFQFQKNGVQILKRSYLLL